MFIDRSWHQISGAGEARVDVVVCSRNIMEVQCIREASRPTLIPSISDRLARAASRARSSVAHSKVLFAFSFRRLPAYCCVIT